MTGRLLSFVEDARLRALLTAAIIRRFGTACAERNLMRRRR